MNFEKLTAYMDGLDKEWNIPARDLIVTMDGKCIYRHFSGCRDEAGNVPMNGSEAYWIYSMTKPMTIACALKLIEDGRMGFEDKVCQYLPEYARHPDMTIEHLMSMRGGLDYDFINPPAMQGVSPDETTRQIAARIAERELHFRPGTDFMYSLCHDVLAAVIEVVSGMKFGEFMKQFIFDPMGMERTTFRPTDWHRANICAQYVRAEGLENEKIPDMENIYAFSENYESGGAGIMTTTEDYAKFVTGVVCGKLLRPETVEAWRWRQNTGKARASYEAMGRPCMNYALGVQVVVDTSQTPAPLGLFGWDGAAGAACMMDPAGRIAYVYMQHVKGCGPAYSDVHPMIRDLIYEAIRAEGNDK